MSSKLSMRVNDLLTFYKAISMTHPSWRVSYRKGQPKLLLFFINFSFCIWLRSKIIVKRGFRRYRQCGIRWEASGTCSCMAPQCYYCSTRDRSGLGMKHIFTCSSLGLRLRGLEILLLRGYYCIEWLTHSVLIDGFKGKTSVTTPDKLDQRLYSGNICNFIYIAYNIRG